MIRSKYPIEYELTPETLEKGTDWWVTLRLKNIGQDKLQNLGIKMHSIDSFHISFRNPSDHIYLLNPEDEGYRSFQVDANATSKLYISIHARKNGDRFHWDSPWIREEVLGVPAELESILVSNPYGTIGRELDVEATVKGMGNSDGLRLEFWTDTPSGKYEELAEIKTKKISRGEEASYIAKITPKEEGYYTVYANLYNNYENIGRKFETIWVEK
jgi:uncharacterized membrane protein